MRSKELGPNPQSQPLFLVSILEMTACLRYTHSDSRCRCPILAALSLRSRRGRTRGVPRMLLKLTCPSCGRSDQASDRVIGKEIRCPCGATFRVLGPKQGATVDPVPRRPGPSRRLPILAPPRQPETRSRPPSSSRPRMRPLIPPSTGDRSGASQPCRNRQGPDAIGNQHRAACLHGPTRPLGEAQSCLSSSSVP